MRPIWILFFMVLVSFHCALLTPPPPKKPVPQTPPAINRGDSLPISQIVRIRKDGHREILATGPEAMRYIFYRAGCKDGSTLAGLLQHEWNDNSRKEKWTGACRSLRSDVVYFRISHPGNRLKYAEFGKITYPFLRMAEEKRNPEYFAKAIEYEPALADARLNLFQVQARIGNCKSAKRHLDIFLRLSPGFPQKYSLQSFYKKKCQ